MRLIVIAHLDVIAEHVVKSDFQARNARSVAFALLYFQKIVLAGGRNVAQLVQFLAHAGSDHAALRHEYGRVGGEGLADALAQLWQRVEPLADFLDRGVVGMRAGIFQQRRAFERTPQLLQLARIDAPRGHFRHDALHIAHLRQFHFAEVAKLRLAEEMLHAVLPLHDVAHRPQGKEHPAMQQPGAHRRERAVDDGEERSAALAHRFHQFEIADGELVEAHVAVFLNAAQGGDVADVRVLRHVEVAEDNACRHRGIFQVFHAEAFEVFHLEMLQQLLARRVAREGPVVYLKDKEARAEHLREAGLAAALHQHLFRRKAAQELVDIFRPPLCHEKLAR